MSNYSRGEVVLVRYPFSDYQVPKLGPPLLLVRLIALETSSFFHSRVRPHRFLPVSLFWRTGAKQV